MHKRGMKTKCEKEHGKNTENRHGNWIRETGSGKRVRKLDTKNRKRVRKTGAASGHRRSVFQYYNKTLRKNAETAYGIPFNAVKG